MVQMQTYTTSDYLFFKNCFDKIKSLNGKKKIFNSFETSKNIISKFSGRALIGQNDP